MKKIIQVLFMLLCIQQAFAQHVYQIRADSVRIYNVCDTAELIIENRTRGVSGFLYNKGNGVTEFRRIQLESVGNGQIAIIGQDTLDLNTLPGIGGIDTIYRSGNNIIYVKKGVQHTINLPAPANTWQDVMTNGNTSSLTPVVNPSSGEGLKILHDDGFISGYTGNGFIRNGFLRFSNSSLNLYTERNIPMYFGTGSLTRLAINDNGNVGIGTTTPSVKLDVNGAINSSSSIQASFFKGSTPVYSTGGYNLLVHNLTTNTYERTTTIPASMITGSVGTNSSWQGVMSNGNTSSITPVVTTDEALRIVNDNGYIAFLNSANNVRGGYIQRISTGGLRFDAENNGPLDFLNNNSLKMRLQSTGYLGLGTGNDIPKGKLEVREDGSSFSWYGRVISSNSDRDIATFIGNYNGIASVSAHNFALSAWRPLYVNSAYDGTSLSGGEVIVGNAMAIGKTEITSGFRLDVNGPTLARGIVGLNDPALDAGLYANGQIELRSSTYPAIGFHKPGEAGGALYLQPDASQANLRWRTSANQDYQLLHTGNHTPGTAFTQTLSGANVLSSFTTNASGHVTGFTVRTLTAADIGAASTSGNGNFVLNQLSSPQTAEAWLSGTVRAGAFMQQRNASNPQNDAGTQLWNSMGGANMYIDPEFRRGYNSLTVYNNLGGTAVQLYRENSLAGVPNTSGYYLRVEIHPGTSNGIQPALGGFTGNMSTNINQVYVTRIRAKIPTGYSINYAANSFGNNAEVLWLTDQAGTGKWKDYMVMWRAGDAGTFSTVNFFYINGPSADINCYVAYFDTKNTNASNWMDNVTVNPVTARPVGINLNTDETSISQGEASSVRLGSAYGYVNVGAQSLDWLHFYTDRPRFYFNKPAFVTDQISVFNNSLAATTYMTQNEMRVNNNVVWHEGNLTFFTKGNDVRLKTESSGYFGIENWIRIADGTGLYTNSGKYLYNRSDMPGSWSVRSANGQTAVWFDMQTGDAISRGGFYADSGGNVGIVNALANGWRIRTDAAGNTLVTGQVQATSFYQSSLRSLKKNIGPFSASALDILNKAQVRSFQFKADSTGHTNIGFIADEVPNEMSTPGRKGVDQASTVGLLVKSVQELSTKNEALEAKVQKLEALIEKLLEEKNK